MIFDNEYNENVLFLFGLGASEISNLRMRGTQLLSTTPRRIDKRDSVCRSREMQIALFVESLGTLLKLKCFSETD